MRNFVVSVGICLALVTLLPHHSRVHIPRRPRKTACRAATASVFTVFSINISLR